MTKLVKFRLQHRFQASAYPTASLTWIGLVIELLVTVHPHLGSPQKVVVEDAGHPSGPAVGGGLPEHVAHPRAGHNQHLTPAHPDLKAINQRSIKTSSNNARARRVDKMSVDKVD